MYCHLEAERVIGSCFGKRELELDTKRELRIVIRTT